jgi:hypothetical protein
MWLHQATKYFQDYYLHSKFFNPDEAALKFKHEVETFTVTYKEANKDMHKKAKQPKMVLSSRNIQSVPQPCTIIGISMTTFFQKQTPFNENPHIYIL